MTIDDKHIETIPSQMMRKVQVTTRVTPSSCPGFVDRHQFRIQARRCGASAAAGHRHHPAAGVTGLALVRLLHLGGLLPGDANPHRGGHRRQADHPGLKENVILGHLVPTGTGFRDHSRTRVKKNIDFGEIGGGFGAAADPTDDDMAALLSGSLDPLSPTGSDAPEQKG